MKHLPFQPTSLTSLKRIFILSFVLLAIQVGAFAEHYRYSRAGYYDFSGSGRISVNMNSGWRLHKGDISGQAYSTDFDDSSWSKVNLPDGIELLPVEASGGKNYQGEVWYRKHFTLNPLELRKKMFLYFEGIMGKCKIWVNGKQLTTHFGGFLPVIVDISKMVYPDKENVIAVWADNSDDDSYPPGKSQNVLDFCYFGGIYRDCWLIGHDDTFITDPNFVDKTAGGGLFVSFSNVSERRSTIDLRLNVANEKHIPFKGKVQFSLFDNNRLVAKSNLNLNLNAGQETDLLSKIDVSNPHLWSPESPYLYDLQVSITNSKGKLIDGYVQKIGIRFIEMRGKEGFFLNGKPYRKLIGANRHQDFALLGFALPNSLHYRDVLKLKNTGMNVIRSAHYPQDPAFMDACDKLGMFVIVATPGWQFWNNDPKFANYIYSDIKNMVRRDRNRPSVLMWEPILNETRYPKDFAKRANNIVHEEYPFKGCYTACDDREAAAGREFFSVMYGMPQDGSKDSTKCYFTREWGDNVDDWNSQNSTSRASKDWGEIPMLIQAKHYSDNGYSFPIDLKRLYAMPKQHIGGAVWHSFDHQRGYHPDPFFGGIMDAFRLPKTSYYMFQSQRDPNVRYPHSESGPMVHIANIMSPFSPKDVTVYSNCDQVRLTIFGKDTLTYTRQKAVDGFEYPIITFPNAFDFMKLKALHRANNKAQAYMKAEGLIGGKVVATHTLSASDRPTKLVLEQDNMDMPLVADGSDVIVVVARMVDEDGFVKRLNNSMIQFSIEGEGRLLIPTPNNIVKLVWGEAPVLVKTTNKSGEIKVTARLVNEGSRTPFSGSIVLKSIDPDEHLNYLEKEIPVNNQISSVAKSVAKDDEKTVKGDLKQVESQQTLFE